VSVLEGFDAVDELSVRLEAEEGAHVEVHSSEFELGPLAEVLVLRRAWRESGRDVRLRSDSDARHAVLLKAAQSTGRMERHVGAFHIIGRREAVELAAHEFVASTGKLAAEAGMPVGATHLLKGVFGELIDNVSQHAGSTADGFAAYELGSNRISLVVADAGQGVVQGYVECQPRLAGLSAMDALEWAVQEHRSRFNEPGRGMGFSSVLRAMRTMDAALRVRSDEASIEIEGPADTATWYVREQPMLRGFVVSLHLTWR
jgi:anti-sigma regulatory factor (Ser/Thr protein kinase)